MSNIHLVKPNPPKTRHCIMALIRKLCHVAVTKEIVYIEINYKIKSDRSRLESISLDVG